MCLGESNQKRIVEHESETKFGIRSFVDALLCLTDTNNYCRHRQITHREARFALLTHKKTGLEFEQTNYQIHSIPKKITLGFVMMTGKEFTGTIKP